MNSLADSDDYTGRRFSLRALFGVHGAAAAVADFVANAPWLAALFAVVAAFILLQFGVLAACTLHLPRSR